MLATGIDVIDVSIDAATPETYAQVRPGRNGFNFYRVVERNVRALIAARDAADPPGRTRVMVNLIDQPLAHADVAQFTRQWSDWGADAVLIRRSTAPRRRRPSRALPLPPPMWPASPASFLSRA